MFFFAKFQGWSKNDILDDQSLSMNHDMNFSPLERNWDLIRENPKFTQKVIRDTSGELTFFLGDIQEIFTRTGWRIPHLFLQITRGGFSDGATKKDVSPASHFTRISQVANLTKDRILSSSLSKKEISIFFEPFQKEEGGGDFFLSRFLCYTNIIYISIELVFCTQKISQLQSFPTKGVGDREPFGPFGTPRDPKFSAQTPLGPFWDQVHDGPVHDIVRRHYNTVYRTRCGFWWKFQGEAQQSGGYLDKTAVFFLPTNFFGGGFCFFW